MHRFILFILLIFSINQGFSQCDTLQGEVQLRYFSDINVYQWDNPYVDLNHEDGFPNNPDYVRTIFSLATPNNYADYYGSQIKGYIRTDVGGDIVFNVNADDTVSFHLSTDNTIENLALINADTNQIANLDTITLVANQYYYFELTHVERAGADFASVEWKADFLTGGMNAANWTIVGGDYLYNVCEPICEEAGKPCDDDDANTQNDQWDGNCHCTGDPITENTCVGERGSLQAYLYKELPGPQTEPLDSVIENNIQPDTVELLGTQFLERYYLTEGADSNYGTFIQGFLAVPVTGLYSFNITGSHENHFFISSDDSPSNKTAHDVWIPWSAGTYQHANPDYEMYNAAHNQSEENILLEAGRYYYVELRHKGAANNWQNFNLYWKTPYQVQNEWKRMPTFYFFDYTCETTCIKNGVGCNDNDPYTANDQWDGNCNCSGTPCTAPDCDDPTTSFMIAEECETTNEVSNRADDGWLSCAPIADAPYAARNGRHWIQYDFGQLYDLGPTHVWNYNAFGAHTLGFESVIIDYSTDGIYWQTLTTTNWDLADGTIGYAGFEGPDFSGITARYVLVSAADDGVVGCRGIHKITFNAVSCPTIALSNLPLDPTFLAESAINTVNIAVTGGEAAINSVALFLDDTWIGADNTAPYDFANLSELQNLTDGDYKLSTMVIDTNGTECELATQLHVVGLANIPCEGNALNLDTSTANIYRTETTITSTSTISSPNPIHYIAGESITLMPGFDAQAGSDFTAIIAECSTPTLSEPLAQTRMSNPPKVRHKLKLFPNPVVDNFTLEINTYQAGKMELRVYDVLGKEIADLARQQTIDQGKNNIILPAAALTAGLYYCKIRIGATDFTKSFVRVDR